METVTFINDKETKSHNLKVLFLHCPKFCYPLSIHYHEKDVCWHQTERENGSSYTLRWCQGPSLLYTVDNPYHSLFHMCVSISHMTNLNAFIIPSQVYLQNRLVLMLDGKQKTYGNKGLKCVTFWPIFIVSYMNLSHALFPQTTIWLMCCDGVINP